MSFSLKKIVFSAIFDFEDGNITSPAKAHKKTPPSQIARQRFLFSANTALIILEDIWELLY
jgi:hypothetical protein